MGDSKGATGSEFNKHRAEFRNKANALGHDVQELGRVTRDIAHDAADLLRENAGSYYKQGMDKAQKLEENLEVKIKENPIRSILIAAGVGLLLGALIKRR